MDKNVKDSLRDEEAKKILDEFKNEYEINKAEELIGNNIIEVMHNNVKYRVRLLTFNEKEIIDLMRKKKFGQLLKDVDILMEKDLIELYKVRGIDISEMDKKIKRFEIEELDLHMKLGEAISKNENESILKKYKDDIEEVRDKKRSFLIQKTSLLELSLENQLFNYVSELFTYYSSEISIDNKWTKLFSTFEDFRNCQDVKLLEKLGIYTMTLQYGN